MSASPSRRLMWSAASVASAAKGVAHAMPSVTNTLAAVSSRIHSQRRASMGIALLLLRDRAASATDGIRAIQAAQPVHPAFTIQCPRHDHPASARGRARPRARPHHRGALGGTAAGRPGRRRDQGGAARRGRPVAGHAGGHLGQLPLPEPQQALDRDRPEGLGGWPGPLPAPGRGLGRGHRQLRLRRRRGPGPGLRRPGAGPSGHHLPGAQGLPSRPVGGAARSSTSSRRCRPVSPS